MEKENLVRTCGPRGLEIEEMRTRPPIAKVRLKRPSGKTPVTKDSRVSIVSGGARSGLLTRLLPFLGVGAGDSDQHSPPPAFDLHIQPSFSPPSLLPPSRLLIQTPAATGHPLVRASIRTSVRSAIRIYPSARPCLPFYLCPSIHPFFCLPTCAPIPVCTFLSIYLYSGPRLHVAVHPTQPAVYPFLHPLHPSEPLGPYWEGPRGIWDLRG